MPSIERRRILDRGVQGGTVYDPGTADITNPEYLVRPALGARTARILSGRGVFAPGYTIRGEQEGAFNEGVQVVRVLKMVSPLTGQGPASPLATGRYYGMDYSVLTPRILRQRRAVAPNTGYTVVVRPKTYVRRMDSKGAGTVVTV